MATGPTLPPQAYTREILTSAFNWLQTQPESVKKLATTPDALVGLFMRAQRYGASSMEADAPISSQAFMSDLKNLAEGLKQFEDPKANGRSIVREDVREEARAEFKSESRDSRRTINGAPSSAATTPNHVSAAQSQLAQAQQLAQQLAQAAALAQQAQSQTQSHAPTHAAPTAPAPSHASHQTHVSASGSNSAGQYFTTNHHAHQASTFLSMNPNYPSPPPQAPPLPAVPAYAAPTHPPAVAAQSHAPAALSALASTNASERSLQMIQEVKMGLNLSSDAEAINVMVSIAYKHLKNLLM